MRSYIKEEIIFNPVRNELFMERSMINRLKIRLETLDQDLMQIDYSKYFGFKEFEKEKYINTINHRSKKDFKQRKRIKPAIERKWWEEADSLALQNTTNRFGVENWLQREDGCNPRFVAYLKAEMKGMEKQHNQFFKKLSAMNKVFF